VIQQVGAIYIWTYVYIIMRIYADNSAENTKNVSIADSESYTEALLPSSEKSSCHDHSVHAELPETMSGGKVRFPSILLQMLLMNFFRQKLFS
jgi:hypothetical protein